MKNSVIRLAVGLGVMVQLSGCGAIGNLLNPFYEPPKPIALLGAPNDHALSEGGNKVQVARQALDAMASYQRTHLPQPQNPVINPAIVRLMWIPDHLNASGDLVPAHYYYLKVRGDSWAVTDAFELESQLKTTGAGAGNVPYITENEALR